MVVTKSGFFTGLVQPPPSRLGDLKVPPQTDAGKTSRKATVHAEWKKQCTCGSDSAGLRKIIVHLVMAVAVARECAAAGAVGRDRAHFGALPAVQFDESLHKRTIAEIEKLAARRGRSDYGDPCAEAFSRNRVSGLRSLAIRS
jgi:hypothetical protein